VTRKGPFRPKKTLKRHISHADMLTARLLGPAQAEDSARSAGVSVASVWYLVYVLLRDVTLNR
jgi:hypothetical protein